MKKSSRKSAVMKTADRTMTAFSSAVETAFNGKTSKLTSHSKIYTSFASSDSCKLCVAIVGFVCREIMHSKFRFHMNL